MIGIGDAIVSKPSFQVCECAVYFGSLNVPHRCSRRPTYQDSFISKFPTKTRFGITDDISSSLSWIETVDLVENRFFDGKASPVNEKSTLNNYVVAVVKFSKDVLMPANPIVGFAIPLNRDFCSDCT